MKTHPSPARLHARTLHLTGKAGDFRHIPGNDRYFQNEELRAALTREIQ